MSNVVCIEMVMPFVVAHLPLGIETAIDSITGFFDTTVTCDEWVFNRQQLYNKFHMEITDDGYVFEEEMYYTWLLLSFSGTMYGV